MREELPKGWTFVSGRDLFSFVTSGSRDWAKYYSNEGDLFIRVGNLNRNSIDLDLSTTQHVSPPEGAEGRRTAIEAGDLLISITADVGMLGVAPAGLGPAYVNQHVAIARPKKGIEPRYLAWFLASESHGQAQFRDSNRGATKAGLGLDDIRNLSIHFAPLPEQRRIVAKLEALLAKVDASRKRLERIPVILKRFRQAVLAAACDGRLTEDWRAIRPKEPDWLPVCLGEVAKDFSYGSAAKSSKSGLIPVLRMGNIQDGRLDWSDLVFTSDKHEINKYNLMPGDVLFNRTNSPELVGKTAVYNGERQAVYAGYLIKIQCSEVLIPDFLNYCLGSPSGKEYCRQIKSDGVSQSNINAKKLAAFEFQLPSVAEQTEIVRRVKDLFRLSDQIEARYAKAKAQVDRLTQSILAKAFRGELVPQDPNDEPADVLLSRLAAAPSEAPAPPPRRGRPPRVQPATPLVATAAPAEDREAPTLADLTPEAILQAHREVLATIPSPLSEDDLLRAVALRLGFQRLGARIKARLRETLPVADSN